MTDPSPSGAAAARLPSRRNRATLIGLSAIALWSTLALATAATGRVPPFQLTAMTFLIGGLAGAVSWLARPGTASKTLHQRPVAWAIGVGGLFGYHFFYFTALKLAPPADAGLIAYLWPLLIVLMSGTLPGERLRFHHIVAALMGFAGTVVLFLGRGDMPEFAAASTLGYAAAFACAFIWSSYSIASRRYAADVPTDAVAGFCLVTAALGALCHIAIETTVWPLTATTWIAVVALGLGPVGLAFYAWDHGVKHGDIRLLGVASYAAPVLSTLLLVATGYAQASPSLGLACALIVGGAALASWHRRG